MKWKVYFTAYEKVMGKSHPKKNQHMKQTLMKWMNRKKSCAKGEQNSTEATSKAAKSRKSNIEDEDENTVQKENLFFKKAKIVKNLFMWYKPMKNERKVHGSIKKQIKDLEKPISEYNAWQQLRLFQKTISLAEDEQVIPTPTRTPKKLRRQKKVSEDCEILTKYACENSEPKVKLPPPYKPPPPYQTRKGSILSHLFQIDYQSFIHILKKLRTIYQNLSNFFEQRQIAYCSCLIQQ